MNIFNFIPIRVHCWGGLGSQLYALALATDLKIKFPTRKIKIILHTSGVTRRVSELNFILDNNFEIVQINDFNSFGKSNKAVPNSHRIKLKNFIKLILSLLRVVMPANSDEEFRKVTFWTFSIRGHYFNRTISEQFYAYILSSLKLLDRDSKQTVPILAVHYRLGDLLEISEKNPVDAAKIINVIDEFIKDSNDLKILVYSDSPDTARETLINAGFTKNFVTKNLSTVDVIRNCLGVKFFIGTNSKVSLWIVNLRRFLGESEGNFIEGFDDKLYKAS
jgi:hypothetical protein